LPQRHPSTIFRTYGAGEDTKNYNLNWSVQGSKFKGYNRLKLQKILIKIRDTCH